MLPLTVMLSTAFKTMPVGYQRVLWLLAAQYDGTNNGNLALTRKGAKHFGLNDERTRSRGLRELEKRGLIEKTKQGGIASGAKHPTLWALTWQPVQYDGGERRGVVRLASHAYSSWRDQSYQCASSMASKVIAKNGSHDTQCDSSDPRSTAINVVAPSETLGVSPPSADGVH